MAKIIDNISILNKVILGLLLTLLISLGVAISEFNRIVQIQNNFYSREVISDYQLNLLALQNLYYSLDVNVIKLANAKKNEDLVRHQNEYIGIDIKINNTFKNLNNIDLSEVKKEEDLIFLTSINDSIYKFQSFYTDKIILALKKLDEYTSLVFHPDVITENYRTLLAEQENIDSDFSLETQTMSDEYIVEELTKVYRESVASHQRFIVSSLASQENSINNILYGIHDIIKEHDMKVGTLKKTSARLLVIGIFISLIFITMFGYIISTSIIKPLFQTNDLIRKLSLGEITESSKLGRSDEIGIILESLNELVSYLKKTTQFSKEISLGNFGYSFSSAGETDILGNTLLELKDSLVSAKHEEKKREVEDSRRRRTADGIAIFSDILRQNQNNLASLGREVISKLVKFIKANQGVIFTSFDIEGEIYLRLLSAYAWNREKFLEKDIKIGDGLIGSVAQEKFTVYMTDVPEDYIEIKSGTGSANPKSILIVPLKVEEEVLGVMEIASFQEFEQYEIELVELIAENIASTLKSVKITDQTGELLEKFQIQAAEMKEQEYAMKSTIDELQASKEEQKKKEENMQRNILEINDLNKQIKKKEEQLKLEISHLTSVNKERLSKLDNFYKEAKTILGEVESGVVILKNSTEIDYVNKSAESIFEYLEMELLGLNIEKIIQLTGADKKKKLVEIFKELHNEIGGEQGKTFSVRIKGGKLRKMFIKVMFFSTEEEGIRIGLLITNKQGFGQVGTQDAEFVNQLMLNEFKSIMKIEHYENYINENKLAVPEFYLDNQKLIAWGPKYQLGISMIDNQHKKWIDIINKLYTNIVEKRSNSELSVIFKKLLDYTDYHFGFEEKYMKDFGYEDLEAHHVSHDKFINEINQMFADYLNGQSNIAYKLIIYLKKWVSHHVLIIDKQYVELFKKHGI